MHRHRNRTRPHCTHPRPCPHPAPPCTLLLPQLLGVLAMPEVDSNTGFCASCGSPGDLIACDG